MKVKKEGKMKGKKKEKRKENEKKIQTSTPCIPVWARKVAESC